MERLKIEVTNLDNHMGKQNRSLKAALEKKVIPEGLREKITEKFMGYLSVNVKNKKYTQAE